MAEVKHIPVLLNETVDLLDVKENGIFIHRLAPFFSKEIPGINVKRHKIAVPITITGSNFLIAEIFNAAKKVNPTNPISEQINWRFTKYKESSKSLVAAL